MPLAASVAILALSGCTGESPAPGSASQTPPNATSAPASATASATPPGGSITQTVAPRTQTTAKPVDLNKKQQSDGIEVSLKSIVSKNVKGRGPGEISGPSLVVTIAIRNGSKTALNVDSAIVNLVDSKGDVGSPMTEGAAPFAGEIAPGDTATGVYVFRVGKNARSPIHISVTSSPEHVTALFVGNVK